MKLSDEQREEIQQALKQDDKSRDKRSTLYRMYIIRLLSSEQAWREEAERLQSVCKQLIGEEVMFQEGRYETEMSKLQSASQLQSSVYRKLEFRHRKKCDHLNQAMQALEYYADKENYSICTLLNTQPVLDDNGLMARATLEYLSFIPEGDTP